MASQSPAPMTLADASAAEAALQGAQQVSFKSIMLGSGPRFARDAFGPVLATASTVPDPHALSIRCAIERDGRVLYDGQASTRDLKRRCEELVDWLGRYNPIPPGTVLSTGTGILVPDEHALRDGDVVRITIEPIGTLTNPVRRLVKDGPAGDRRGRLSATGDPPGRGRGPSPA